jgi:hypothetical protein
MNGSLITRIGMALLNEGFLAAARSDDEHVREEQDLRYEDKRERALEKMEPVARSLQHTRVPPYHGKQMGRWRESGLDAPLWGDPDDEYTERLAADAEMIRLAAVGVDIGAELAKTAGFSLTPMADIGKKALEATKSLGQQGVQAAKKTMGHVGLAVGAGTLAAGALGAYGVNKGVQALGQPAPGPATFGGGRFGQQLAYGTNQYGQPQLGTPLL